MRAKCGLLRGSLASGDGLHCARGPGRSPAMMLRRCPRLRRPLEAGAQSLGVGALSRNPGPSMRCNGGSGPRGWDPELVPREEGGQGAGIPAARTRTGLQVRLETAHRGRGEGPGRPWRQAGRERWVLTVTQPGCRKATLEMVEGAKGKERIGGGGGTAAVTGGHTPAPCRERGG